MATHDDLHLHEELLLLALKDSEGTVASGAMIDFALGGAVLAELMLSGRIATDGEPKKPRVEVRDRKPLGDPLLDEWLETITGREKPRTVQDWVGRTARTKDLKHRVALQLVRRGVLRTDEDKVLWIFNRKIYPEVDPRPERELIVRIERVIFSDQREVDPHDAVLIALAHRTKILPVAIDKKRLKGRKQRLEQIAKGDLTAEATKGAIEAMQAAVMVAVILPSVVATTTASH